MPTTQQIEKLGNTLIYLSKEVSELNKTKILKLLFLLEEASIKKYGHPFFGFDFELWKHGPVLKSVFVDLSDETSTMLNGYIEKSSNNPSLYQPVKEFCDDEFSDNDMIIMDHIVRFAKNKTASDLVKHTHNETSLWRKSALKNGILEQLESETQNTSRYTVDFSLLFEDDNFLKEKYESSIENLEFINHLKK